MYKPLITIAAVTLGMASLSACSEKQGVSFSQDVHPILKTECLECHAKGKEGHQKSGLSMETYAELMAGTTYGPVIEPGSAVSSTLVRLIDHKADKSINMPHQKSKIPPDEIKIIKQWIDEGASNN
jgi:uncharacterized membrane protein